MSDRTRDDVGRRRALLFGFVLAGAAFAGCGGVSGMTVEGPLDAGDEGDAGADGAMPGCEPESRPGDPAGAEGESTEAGVLFNVRTPMDYDATVLHPLIVVYAPAGGDALVTEQFTGLTPDAVARGYVIAYADHVSPRDPGDIEDLATIPDLVAKKWCIDTTRIYLTGHSDGGSTATLIAIRDLVATAAIAPSASGTNGMFLAQNACVDPLPVMVLHGSRDALFPGFGAQAAKWWASCNGCDPMPGPPLPDGCVVYGGCTDYVEVQYCETNLQHGQWPRKNKSMLDFFARFQRTP